MSVPDLGDAFVSSDAVQLRDVVQDLTVPHHVEAAARQIDGLTRSRVLNLTNLVFVRYGADVVVEAAPAGERFGLTLPLGPMSVGHARLAEHGSRQTSFVLSRERRTLMVPDPYAGAIVVAADAARLHRHLCAVLGYEVDGPVEFTERPVGAVLPPGYLDGLLRATWAAASAAQQVPPTTARLLEQTLLTGLLLGLPHSYTDLLRTAPTHAATARAREAREWMQAHYAEPIGVLQVARAVSLSVRQLQSVFAREHRAAPMDVLREIRLTQAHQLLVEGTEQPLSVTAVASRCGFGHLGRFSRAYYDRFSEPPSQTLARHRRSGASS